MSQRPWAEIRPLLVAEVKDLTARLKIERDHHSLIRLQARIEALEWTINQEQRPQNETTQAPEDILYT